MRGKWPPAAARAILDALKDAQQLPDPADQESLLIDLNPGSRRGREDHVIAWLDGHLDPDVVPPIESRANRQHDSVLGRRFVGAGRDHETRAANAVGIELLDHNAIEKWSQLVAHGVVHL